MFGFPWVPLIANAVKAALAALFSRKQQEALIRSIIDGIVTFYRWAIEWVDRNQYDHITNLWRHVGRIWDWVAGATRRIYTDLPNLIALRVNQLYAEIWRQHDVAITQTQIVLNVLSARINGLTAALNGAVAALRREITGVRVSLLARIVAEAVRLASLIAAAALKAAQALAWIASQGLRLIGIVNGALGWLQLLTRFNPAWFLALFGDFLRGGTRSLADGVLSALEREGARHEDRIIRWLGL